MNIRIRAVLASAVMLGGSVLGTVAMAAPAHAATAAPAPGHEDCSVVAALEDITHGNLNAALEDVGNIREALQDLLHGQVAEAVQDITKAECR